MSEEHPAGTIVDVRCRLFEAPTEGGGVRYANPLRGRDPSRDERGFAFPRWLVVEVETSTGIVGIGDAALAADLIPPIVVTRLKPLVVGRPVASIQETWQLMYRGTIAWGRKGLGMVAISAVDLALWDALGKALGAPVYDLLGGRRADSIRVYASRLYGSDSLDDLAAEAQRYADQGFTAFKQRFLWGPPDGRKGMRANVDLVRTVREVVGEDADLMADAYMGWNLDYARAMVRLLEPFDLRWLEEALVPDDLEGYAALTRDSPIPIAHGEHEFTLRRLRRDRPAGRRTGAAVRHEPGRGDHPGGQGVRAGRSLRTRCRAPRRPGAQLPRRRQPAGLPDGRVLPARGDRGRERAAALALRRRAAGRERPCPAQRTTGPGDRGPTARPRARGQSAVAASRPRKAVEARLDRVLVDHDVDRIREDAESALDEHRALLRRVAHHADRLPRCGAGGQDPVDRLVVALAREVAGNPQRRGQVEVADPEDVDPLDGGDLLDGVEAQRRLDLHEHERLRVRLLDRRGDALGLPFVPH